MTRAASDSGSSLRAALKSSLKSARRSFGTDSPVWTALSALALSFLVAAVAALLSGWQPISDDALIELRVRAIPADMPLLGAYSRLGGFHLGPGQFLLLSIPYRILGSRSSALLVGTLLIHLTAIVLAWLSCRRVNRTTGLVVAAALALTLLSQPAYVARSPWNPYFQVVLIGALVALGWGTTRREVMSAALLTPVASLLIQSHTGTLPIVGATVLVSIVLMFLGVVTRDGDPGDPARSDRVHVPWRAILVGLAVSFGIWLPPLLQQVTNSPGNLTTVFKSLRNPQGDALGLSSGLAEYSHAFSILPDWLLPAHQAAELFNRGAAIPVLLLIPLAGAVLAWRRRDRVAFGGLAVATTAVLGGIVAAASITGSPYSYLISGQRALGAMLVAVGLAAIIGSERIRVNSTFDTLSQWLAATVCCLVAVGLCVSHLNGDDPTIVHGRVAVALADRIIEDAHGEPLGLEGSTSLTSTAMFSGVYLQLERRGTIVSVSSGFASAAQVPRHNGRQLKLNYYLGDESQRSDLEEFGFTVLEIPELADLKIDGWPRPLLARMDGNADSHSGGRGQEGVGVGSAEAGPRRTAGS